MTLKRSVLVLASVALAVATLGSVAHPETVCMGDCDSDGTIAVSEIVRGVAIALGTQNVAACDGADGNDDGRVTIDELTESVVQALEGCGLPDGSPCILRTDCRKKHCLDSVCCDQECQEGRCTRPDRLGICTPVMNPGEQCTTDLDCRSKVCTPLGICCERECPTLCRSNGSCVIESR